MHMCRRSILYKPPFFSFCPDVLDQVSPVSDSLKPPDASNKQQVGECSLNNNKNEEDRVGGLWDRHPAQEP